MEGNVKSWGAVRMHRMTAYNRELFGRVIQQRREMKGWNQTRLAEALHVGKSMVFNWESGISRPDIEMIPPLCRILDIPIPVFYGAPADRMDLEPDEKLFLSDYSDLEQEDRRLIDAVMQRMVFLEGGEMHAQCRERFVRIPQYDSEDFYKPRHGNHFCWVRKTPEEKKPDFLVTVEGSSLGPDFADQDDLMARRTSEIADGKYGFVLLDDEPVLLRRRGGTMTGFQERIRIPYNDRKRLQVLGEITRKLVPSDYPSAKERMLLGK